MKTKAKLPELFELTPPPAGVLTLEQAAESFGVSRQAFHRWAVTPVRIAGREKLFNLATVLENRLAAFEDADTTPAEAELERLQARLELLSEQLEAQQLWNQAAADASIQRAHAALIISRLMEAAAAHVDAIPARIAAAVKKAAGARDLIETETRAAAALLRMAELPEADPAGHPGVYT